MKSIKSLLVVFSSVSLIFLGACGNENPTTNAESSPTPAETMAQKTDSNSNTTESSGHAPVPQAGGQVVESGPYHLEFVPVKEDSGTHLDFYLQKGDNHEPIPNAKVTALVQLPDGTQKTLDLPYDAEGKHYAALLPGKVSGQHQVKITSDVDGEKVDGRFSFSQ